MIRVLTCVAQQHDLRLIALSAVICALGCFATVTLMARTDAGGRPLPCSLLIAALIFGGSVWSLHFVAMLAFRPGAQVAYDLDLTAGSIVVAVAGAFAALRLWRRLSSTPLGIVLAGTVLGLAITGMHYLGVGAMAASSLVLFEPIYVAASILVSVAFSVLALARAGVLASLGRRIEVTGWLALAICGLHFTGMTAVTVAPIAPRADESYVLGSTPLALTIAAVSLAVLIAGLVALALQQHLSQRDRRELDRMRLLSNLAYEVLFIHRDGVVLEVNQAGTRLFGMAPDQIVGRPVLDLFSQASTPGLLRRTRCRSEELRPEEFEARTAAGTHVPVELSCRTIEFGGKPATAVALRDLTDRKRDEARIRHLALHDALTDLPNRYLLEQRLGPALEAAALDGTGVAVIYLDLDRFKAVNDLHGHATGDALLVQVAKRMLTELRPSDTLARVGGDEFVAVLTGARAPQRGAEIAGRLVGGLRRPFRIDDHRVEIGASAGIALYPGDGRTAEALLRAADTALYRVKDEGRGAVRFFEAAMDAELQARRQLEHELGGAIARDELRLFYQPIVNARTGEIETFEALIRWQHPERGFVSPAEFIPVAEQADLIGRIGEWVIDTACAAAAAWPQPWRVSVNVSPTQFRQSDVPTVVAAALARHGLAPARLVIEITESVFIQDAAKAVRVLTDLRGLGVRLALDDFGTGYSSLSYLQQFRFDKIKVDQSFVRRLGQHADTLAIVRAIVNLGHNLGLQVTVEGVETAEQLAILRELHCEQMQGYLFARPAPTLPASELELARLRALFAVPPIKALA
ncbi:bifunctional diguanylate cyclase/phosphodiesterase [Methylobacterium pseudosasicola]|uniref:PAS domain S-box-containing protein/diguanylate cyclase (GGDEF) domain-containing protein n=1 Tax=Methylobacterium pseudosasicola TaxID=582667 RepID=A0A1I4T7D9_9HYPH|nr:EAL domain-containing protein [Methylobacterium pseudosasicola]SFM72487.1 PAS domain S-box-containing protein/diguanylate cyclase (GGDEF) domain-containing protein [Methylobacterium pseudosasicola]